LHRELLLMRIGVLSRSEYEYAAHSRIGRRLGMTDADVARILNGVGGGSNAIEAALLRAAKSGTSAMPSAADVERAGGRPRSTATARRADRRRRLSLDVHADQQRWRATRRQHGGLPVPSGAALAD